MSKPRTLPLGDELQPTIDRLKAIAAEAGDHLLLADGPVHPDAKLLDLCGEALHLLRHSNELQEQYFEFDAEHFNKTWTDTMRAHSQALFDERELLDAQATQILRRATKLRASTPAGIYAKALLVRVSRTGAVVLAMSLAEELIDCRELRQSLWAAEGSTAHTTA